MTIKSDFLNLFLPNKRPFPPEQTVDYRENWQAMELWGKESIRRPCVRVRRYDDATVTSTGISGSYAIPWQESFVNSTRSDFKPQPDWGMWYANSPTRIYLPYTGFWVYGCHFRFLDGGSIERGVWITPNSDLAYHAAGHYQTTAVVAQTITGGGFFAAGTYLETNTYAIGTTTLKAEYGTPNMWAVCVSRDLDW